MTSWEFHTYMYKQFLNNWYFSIGYFCNCLRRLTGHPDNSSGNDRLVCPIYIALNGATLTVLMQATQEGSCPRQCWRIKPSISEWLFGQPVGKPNLTRRQDKLVRKTCFATFWLRSGEGVKWSQTLFCFKRFRHDFAIACETWACVFILVCQNRILRQLRKI